MLEVVFEVIRNFLGEYVVATAVLAIAAIWGTWNLASAFQKMRDRVGKTEEYEKDLAMHRDKLSGIDTTLSKIEARLGELPCGSHREDLAMHSDRLSAHNASLSRMEGMLTVLISGMPKAAAPAVGADVFSDDMPSISQKHSPRRLNDNGLKIAEVFGCDAFLSENKEWLLAEVDKFAPKTALDVEMNSLIALRIASYDDRFNGIKKQIYNSPAVDLTFPDGSVKPFDVSLENVLYVISLPLRDLYLAAHPWLE